MTAFPHWLLFCQFLLVAGGCADQRDSASASAASAKAPTAAPEPSRSPGQVLPVTSSVPSVRLQVLEGPGVEVVTDRFNSARVCGACHRDIFDKWSRSMHAFAYVDPVFENAFLKAFYQSSGKAAELCLRCHSPTVSETKDRFGKEDLTREGVTCDYCHSTASITEDSDGRMRHTIDHSTKYGPFKMPSPPAHPVEQRAFFEKSEICASCHDYTTPEGTVVFATYAEWRASKYAEEGTQCQDCHMPRLPGSDGVPARQRVFNDHDLQGGHSPSQIKRAVTVRIEEAVRDADRVRVVVSVANSGAGHSVPTGLPSRMLVLVVRATQRGRQVFRRETVYQRVMQGDGYRPLTEDWEIKLRSKRVQRDNRIRSGEVRRETFVFDASPAEDITFSVNVAYRYQPKLAAIRAMEVPITELEKIIRRGL